MTTNNQSAALMDKASIDKAIGKLGRTLVTVRKDIQALAITAIGYSLVHGDVTIGQRLLEAMTKSVRKDSLVAFFEAHGAFAWSKTEKKLVHFKRKGVAFDADYVAMLEGQMWDEAKREPEVVSVYVVHAEFDKFLNRLGKLAKDPSLTLRNKELFEQLEQFSAKYHARKVLGEAADKAVMADDGFGNQVEMGVRKAA